MKKPTIETLVKRLKRLEAKTKRLRIKRDKIPWNSKWFPPEAHYPINDELNATAGDAMRIERQIINALLAQLQ